MRIADPIQRKRQILDATRRLLVQRGFQDIALDEVAKAAGLAKGTLFLYYKSKDDLFAAAFSELADQLGVGLGEVSNSGKRGRELLSETIRVILFHLDLNRDFMAQSIGRLPVCSVRSRDKLLQKFRENNLHLRHILRSCVNDGFLRAGDLEYKSYALFGLCRSAMIEKIMEGSRAHLGENAEKVLEFFLHGVGAKR